MFPKTFWIILVLLFTTKNVVAQSHQELLEILESDMAFDQKEELIYSFLKNDHAKLSQKELAECYHDIGGKWYNTNYSNSDDHSELIKAIAITEKALLLKRKLKANEQCTINKTLYNLGFFNSLDNNLYDAMEYFMEVIRKGDEYCSDGSAGDLIELAYHGMGELYIEVGDFYKALGVYETLIQDYLAQNTLNNANVIWTYIRIAEIYTAIDLWKNSDLVKFNLDKAISHLENSKIPCCFYENRINQLEGNRLWEIKDYSTSIWYYKAVISNLPVVDSFNLAVANNSLGLSHLELGNKKLAEKILLKALLLNPDYDSPYNNLGDLSVKNTQFEKALNSYQRAIDLSIGINLRFRFDQLPRYEQLEYSSNKIKLLNHLVSKANGWIKYYEHDNNKKHLIHALETFILADQLVDLIRFESMEHQSKLFWREQGASLYMKAVEVCHLLNKPEEAYHFMERNKALLLLEDLTNEEAKEIANLPKKAAEKEFNLKRAIFLSENNLQEAGTESKEIMAGLKDSIRENKYRYEQFVDSLNEAYPEYAKFKKKAEILAFKDLNTNYVSDNKAVLHYILNDEQGYGLLTLPDTTLLFQINDIPKLNKDVDTLIATISNGLSNIQTFQKVSNSVFRQLLPENSYDPIRGKQLTIIPDYTLQRIPFEALVVNEDGLKYLIEEVEIGYAYSMSLLDHTMGKEGNPPMDLVAFAPVQFEALGLPQLHFSENEITGVAEVYPGETLINGQATKANFLKYVGGHKIVHLATHADVGDGENPWIAFSDSKMYLKEIYATRNQADMVVLSGCNTSNGALKRGEGVMSLARGFFYSGAKSVVSTLWPAADEAGTDILIGFYENLDQGDSKSEALQKAKLTYLRNTEEVELRHPFYWAGFIVVGDNAPMLTKSNWYWVLLALGLLVLVFLLFSGKLFKGIQ